MCTSYAFGLKTTMKISITCDCNRAFKTCVPVSVYGAEDARYFSVSVSNRKLPNFRHYANFIILWLKSFAYECGVRPIQNGAVGTLSFFNLYSNRRLFKVYDLNNVVVVVHKVRRQSLSQWAFRSRHGRNENTKSVSESFSNWNESNGSCKVYADFIHLVDEQPNQNTTAKVNGFWLLYVVVRCRSRSRYRPDTRKERKKLREKRIESPIS